MVVERPIHIEAALGLGEIAPVLAVEQVGLDGAVEAPVLAQRQPVIGSAMQHAHAEPHQPDRERGVRRPGAAPRRPVVAEDAFGQALAAEEARQPWLHGGGPLVGQGLQANGAARAVVERSQVMAATAGREGGELFEIHMSKLVRARMMERWTGRRRRAAA